jgi:ADP-heptose:LPS heptosyltransferase
LRGVSRLIAKGADLPPIDYHCPLLSLPLALRGHVARAPAWKPYLRPDPTRVAEWQTRLGPAARPRIGLAWSGNPNNVLDRHRSIALAPLLAQLPPDYEYFCLQRDVRESDRAALESHPGLRRFPDDSGFSATAALCELLDAVVSVDTSVAHLSAALGRKTLILLPFKSDWRWLVDRADSPWYPSARLYRQGRDDDWRGVFERLARDLAAAFI